MVAFSLFCLLFVQLIILLANPLQKAVLGDSVKSIRLPNSTFPLHYHWHVHTNIHQGDLNFRGNVTLDIAVRELTRQVVLHAKRLRNFVITVQDLQTKNFYDNLEHVLDEQRDFLVISLLNKEDDQNSLFLVDRQYRLEILYDGEMNENCLGIYWIAYEQIGQQPNIRFQAATQFEPTRARLALPCYDEPAFKAKVSLRITHGSIYHAIGNMPVLHKEQVRDSNMTTSVFETTPPISTYLLAFVVSDFEAISDEYRGIKQRVFTPPQSKQKGESQLKIAIEAVAAFENYLGVNYPLPKLDHITLNKSYGAAMENWGLITYRENYFIYKEIRNPRQRLSDLITQVHEIAHQWFGNLVSPEWWTFAWLNEGFATYFSHIITDLLHPELKIMDYFVITTIQQAFAFTDHKARSHPMTLYVEEESDIEGMFDLISYQKAACVIHMFHHAFQQKIFIAGLNQFLNKYQYSVANEMDLFDCLQNALNESPTPLNSTAAVSEIMSSWTHNKGIPILFVQRHYNNNNNNGNNTVTLLQRSKNIKDLEYFWIPINFAARSESGSSFEATEAQYLMPPVPSVTVNLNTFNLNLAPNDWLIVNKQQTGFYHVIYDDENLLQIARALQENHLAIHELNRVSLFRDLHAKLECCEIGSIEVIFEMLKYLPLEHSVLVWKTVPSIFELFDKHLQATSFYDLYKAFVRHSLKSIYRQLFVDTDNGVERTAQEILAQEDLLSVACSADLPECLEYTHRLAHDFLLRNKTESLAEVSDQELLMYDILCAGMRYLNDEEFQIVATVLASHNKNSQYYEDLLYAVRCTQNETHIYRYLQLLVESEVIADRDTFVNSQQVSFFMHMFFIYKLSATARPIIWRFIERHYQTLSKAHFFVEMFNRLAEYVSTQQLDMFYDLHERISIELAKLANNSTALIAIDSPNVGIKIQRIEDFVAKYGVAISEWLTRNQESLLEETASNGGDSLSLQSSTLPIVGSAIHLMRQMLANLGHSSDFSNN